MIFVGFWYGNDISFSPPFWKGTQRPDVIENAEQKNQGSCWKMFDNFIVLSGHNYCVQIHFNIF